MNPFRWIVLVAIRLYWRIVPSGSRRTCLFKTSCSNAVYNAAHEVGAVRSAQVLIHRISACRPGFVVRTLPDGEVVLTLMDGSTLSRSEASASIASLLTETQGEVSRSFSRMEIRTDVKTM